MTLPAIIEDIPYNDSVVSKNDKGEYMMTDLWVRYFSDTQQPLINAATKVYAVLEDLSRNSALALTAIVESAAGSKYRFNSSIQIVSPDAVSSAVQLTLTYTVNSIVQTETFALLNGNLITTHQSSMFVFRSDSSAPISVAITYASNTPGAMLYDFSFVLELLEA